MWGVGLESAGLTPPLMSCGILVAYLGLQASGSPLRNWGTLRNVVAIHCTSPGTTST